MKGSREHQHQRTDVHPKFHGAKNSEWTVCSLFLFFLKLPSLLIAYDLKKHPKTSRRLFLFQNFHPNSVQQEFLNHQNHQISSHFVLMNKSTHPNFSIPGFFWMERRCFFSILDSSVDTWGVKGEVNKPWSGVQGVLFTAPMLFSLGVFCLYNLFFLHKNYLGDLQGIRNLEIPRWNMSDAALIQKTELSIYTHTLNFFSS